MTLKTAYRNSLIPKFQALAFVFIFALGGSVLIWVSHAATPGAYSLYVDPNSIGGKCSDTYTATQAQSLSTPWCTLAKAVVGAPDGATINVRSSTINLQTIHWPLGYAHVQNRSSFVTFQPYGYGGSAPESVTVNGVDIVGVDHEIWQGFKFVGNDASGVTWAFNINNCNPYISLINNDVSGQGLHMDGRCSFGSADHILIQNNNIHNTTINTGQCSNYDIDGMGVSVANADDIKVLNNTVNTQNDAINFGNASNIIISGNVVQTIYQAQMPSPCTYHVDLVQSENHQNGPVTIRDNMFQQGGQFIIRNQSGLVIENNLVANVYGWMQIVSSPGARIINNTFWPQPTNSGSLLIRACSNAIQNCSTLYGSPGYPTDVSGTVVENNIFYTWGVDTSPTSGFCCVTPSMFTENNNLIYGPKQNNPTPNPGNHDIFAMPFFANPAAFDFHLTNKSPGYGAGDPTVATPTDILGKPRGSSPDIGAFQGVTSGTPPPPPPLPTVSLKASPQSISAGSSSSLTWTSANATSCNASGAWSGSKPVSGSASTGSLNSSLTYTLICNNSGGNASASVSVTVSGANSSAASTTPSATGSAPPNGGINLGNSSSRAPVVSGVILLTSGNIPAKKVTYYVDGNRLASSALDTTQLADGTHSVEAVITEPNGKIITEKKKIYVNNHKSYLQNIALRYKKQVESTGSKMGVVLIAAAAIWGYIILKGRRHLVNKFVNSGEVISSDQPIKAQPPVFQSPAPGTTVQPQEKSKFK